MKKIIVISGSTRNDSMNKKLAISTTSIADIDATVTHIDLKEYPMPLYDGDMEENDGLPTFAKKLKNQIQASDAVVFVTPEYNGSYSAVLKNAIDWTSRPEKGEEGYEAYAKKKALVMAASPTEYGGIRAIKEMQTLASNIHMDVMEEYISLPDSFNAFDEQGTLKDQAMQKKIADTLKKLAE